MFLTGSGDLSAEESKLDREGAEAEKRGEESEEDKREGNEEGDEDKGDVDSIVEDEEFGEEEEEVVSDNGASAEELSPLVGEGGETILLAPIFIEGASRKEWRDRIAMPPSPKVNLDPASSANVFRFSLFEDLLK